MIPDIYIYRMFLTRPDVSSIYKVLYWVPTLLLLGGLIFFYFFANEEMVRGRYTGWFSITFIFFTLPKMVFMLVSVIGLPFNYYLNWPKSPFIYVGLALAVVTAVIVLYGAFWGRNRFVITETTYTSPYVPPGFDGYRITLISDLHIGSWRGQPGPVKRLVKLINEQDTELIVFTGDLVNHRALELDEFQDILAQLSARDGVYSVLGNHDFGPYFPWKNPEDRAANLVDLKRRQAEMGWILLNNDNVIIHNGNDSIALLGVENDGEPPFSQYADLPKALEGTEGLFKVLLSHNPTHWRREVLPDSDIDLMLAGHTHALQLEIAGQSPSSHFYKEWGGMYYEGERGLYVNVGAGHVGLPFRFGAWPEITVITLKHGPGNHEVAIPVNDM